MSEKLNINKAAGVILNDTILMNIDYKTIINIKTIYGYYEWCSKTGEFLPYDSPPTNQQIKKHMVNIVVNMNAYLFKDIDHIDIIDNNGFLIQYTREITDNIYNFFFQINSDKPITYKDSNDNFQVSYLPNNQIGTSLKLLFQKIQPQSTEDHMRLRRVPMKTLHTEIITIPPIENI